MWSPYNLHISASVDPSYQFINANFYEIWYEYHGTGALRNGARRKSLSPLFVYVRMYIRAIAASECKEKSIHPFPSGKKYTQQQKNYWTQVLGLCNPLPLLDSLMQTFRWQRRIPESSFSVRSVPYKKSITSLKNLCII
jgi:hypothetical protein